MCLNTPATSSWSRLIRSRASANTTSKRSRRASVSNPWGGSARRRRQPGRGSSRPPPSPASRHKAGTSVTNPRSRSRAAGRRNSGHRARRGSYCSPQAGPISRHTIPHRGDVRDTGRPQSTLIFGPMVIGRLPIAQLLARDLSADGACDDQYPRVDLGSDWPAIIVCRLQFRACRLGFRPRGRAFVWDHDCRRRAGAHALRC